MLVEQDGTNKSDAPQDRGDSQPAGPKLSAVPQSDYNVTLRQRSQSRRRVDLTEDVRLGTLVVPLTNLPLDKAMNGKESARVEHWYQLESVDTPLATPLSRTKKPSVLLEISFSAPENFRR